MTNISKPTNAQFEEPGNLNTNQRNMWMRLRLWMVLIPSAFSVISAVCSGISSFYAAGAALNTAATARETQRTALAISLDDRLDKIQTRRDNIAQKIPKDKISTFDSPQSGCYKLFEAKQLNASLIVEQFVKAKFSLSKFDLAGMDLRAIPAMDATITGAQMKCANLMSADLSSAFLNKTNFVGANLAGVKFDNSNLTGANLTGVDLTGSSLTGADLTEANLTGANLAGIDLQKVKDIKLCKTIGQDGRLMQDKGCKK
jgi:uncharacterized protein YjbI with pentapeptide repeats